MLTEYIASFERLTKKEKAALILFFSTVVTMVLTSCAQPLPPAGQAEAAGLDNNSPPPVQVDSDVTVPDDLDQAVADFAAEFFGTSVIESSDSNLALAATPTPTPTPISTQEQPQPTETQVPYAKVQKNSNLRADHSTSSRILVRFTEDESVTVIGKVEFNSGYDWYKIKLLDGTIGYIREDLILIDKNEVVEVIENISVSVPTPAPKPPEKQPVVETTNIKYVTVPPGTFLFSSIGSGQIGETAGGPAEYKVIKESRGWVQIECPVDGKQTLLWILSTGMSVRNEAGTTNIIQPTNPGVGQNPNPETAPNQTSSHFDGKKIGDTLIINGADLNDPKSLVSLYVYQGGAYECKLPVTDFVLKDGNVQAEASSAVTFPWVGTVTEVTNNTDGTIKITISTQNGQITQIINQSTRWYLQAPSQLEINYGATMCINPKLSGAFHGISLNQIVGFGPIPNNQVVVGIR